eukprot:scaffold88927_cov46-Prasinocladus_malaysianus.AAC.2
MPERSLAPVRHPRWGRHSAPGGPAERQPLRHPWPGRLSLGLPAAWGTPLPDYSRPQLSRLIAW